MILPPGERERLLDEYRRLLRELKAVPLWGLLAAHRCYAAMRHLDRRLAADIAARRARPRP